MSSTEFSFVVWKESYNTQIEEIDNQHKQLLSILNQLYKLFLNNGPVFKYKDIVDMLYDYTEKHFTYEEELLKKNQYSDLQNHLELHKGFKNEIKKFQEILKDNNRMISYKMINYLGKWLQAHIGGADHKYSKEIQNK